MELTGIIHRVFDTVHVSEKFKKRDIVLEVSETSSKGDVYHQYISFQFVQDKVDILNDYQEGATVEILFNMKGRKWTSPQGEVKYFNTLQAYRIHSEKDGPSNPKPVEVPHIEEPQIMVAPSSGTPEIDQIPF